MVPRFRLLTMKEFLSIVGFSPGQVILLLTALQKLGSPRKDLREDRTWQCTDLYSTCINNYDYVTMVKTSTY